jgi:hypothetical protein
MWNLVEAIVAQSCRVALLGTRTAELGTRLLIHNFYNQRSKRSLKGCITKGTLDEPKGHSHMNQKPWPWNFESSKGSVQRPSQDTSKISCSRCVAFKPRRWQILSRHSWIGFIIQQWREHSHIRINPNMVKFVGFKIINVVGHRLHEHEQNV